VVLDVLGGQELRDGRNELDQLLETVPGVDFMKPFRPKFTDKT
jgi:hypothetical protein